MAILGIDVGGSGIKGALVDVAGGVCLSERVRIETPQPAEPEAVIDVISQMVRQFDYAGRVGVGFPATILDGRVMTAANIADRWLGYPGRAAMSQQTGCAVTLINDADAAGLAEMRFGAGRGREGVVLILTLGTGIGSALFIDGRLVPNTELGHLYLRGRKKDAEYHAAESARSRQKLSWQRWAGRLNEYLHHLEFIFSPRLIIVGGGISKKHDKFLPLLKARAEIVPAELRNDAGIIGAAMAAQEEVGNA
jgi:polyphosphate glucokinase